MNDLHSRFSPLAMLLAWLAPLACCGLASLLAAEPAHPPLPGSELLVGEGDFADRIVSEADQFLNQRIVQSVDRRAQFWHRDFSSPAAYAKSIEPNRARLAKIVGLVEARVRPVTMALQATTTRGARIAQGANYEVFAVAWPAFGDVHGEGLLLVPTGRRPVADVVAIPDCGQTPEQLTGLAEGIAPESQFARRLAESGCRVVVPLLINRKGRPDPVRIYFPKDVYLDNRDWAQPRPSRWDGRWLATNCKKCWLRSIGLPAMQLRRQRPTSVCRSA